MNAYQIPCQQLKIRIKHKSFEKVFINSTLCGIFDFYNDLMSVHDFFHNPHQQKYYSGLKNINDFLNTNYDSHIIFLKKHVLPQKISFFYRITELKFYRNKIVVSS